MFLGWWRGQSGSLTGWFPSNYTTEENDDDAHTCKSNLSILI